MLFTKSKTVIYCFLLSIIYTEVRGSQIKGYKHNNDAMMSNENYESHPKFRSFMTSLKQQKNNGGGQEPEIRDDVRKDVRILHNARKMNRLRSRISRIQSEQKSDRQKIASLESKMKQVIQMLDNNSKVPRSMQHKGYRITQDEKLWDVIMQQQADIHTLEWVFLNFFL